MKICTVTPSRGLVHSRTIEAVRENFSFLGRWFDFKWEHFFTHDKPIPDAQNHLFERAYKWGADYIWSVEEDNVFPSSTLIDMIRTMRDSPMRDSQQSVHSLGVVFVDYPIGKKKYSGICRVDGEILWGPMGCTLIKRDVLDNLDKPWFRNDVSFQVESENPLKLVQKDIPNKYGGHDVWFGIQCRRNDIGMAQVENRTAGHIKAKADQKKSNNNDGFYEFEIWDKIEKTQEYAGPPEILKEN